MDQIFVLVYKEMDAMSSLTVFPPSVSKKCDMVVYGSVQACSLIAHMRRFPEPQHFLLQSDKNGIFYPLGRPLYEL